MITQPLSCPSIPFNTTHITNGNANHNHRTHATELQHVLKPHELAVISTNANRPLACLQALSATVKAAGLDPISTSRLDINLETFEDIMGACERILKTPIPLSCE